MSFINSIFGIFAGPLGWVLYFIYKFIPNYFVAIFLFTLLIRAVTFPLSLKTQKATADRAKLAPRLERLQKKYAKDPKKLQEKQMALYEKEGVSMTAGCLPTLVQMVILFGVIAVIYAPLTYLSHIPEPVIKASVTAVSYPLQDDGNGNKVEVAVPNKLPSKDFSGYYRELRMLNLLDYNKEDVVKGIDDLSETDRKDVSAEDYYDQMKNLSTDFNFFGGGTLLVNPWSDKGFADINILWLIPLLSGLTAVGSSFLSMKFMNLATPGQNQPGQGCTNNMMIWMMPLFSLYITFTVPGAVGIYWICSNIIAFAQTFVLNQIYNPVKIRAQAEIEYEERRKEKLEDKKRLADARSREEAEARRLAKEEKEQTEEKRKTDISPKKPAASKNPNKIKRREKSEQQESDSIEDELDTAAEDSEDISEEENE